MRTRHKSKTRILDQIIVVQVIVLFILIGIFKLTSNKSDKLASNLESYVTPTLGVSTEISPSPILTVSPTIPPKIDEEPNEESISSPITSKEDQTELEENIDSNPKESDTEDNAEDNLKNSESEITDSADSLEAASAGDLQSTDSDTEDMGTNANVPAFANGMSKEFIASLSEVQEGTLIETPGSGSIVYYMQTDPRWASKYYGGTDTIEKYGCAPTSLSMVISSLTDTKIDPVQMCAWAYEKNYWYAEQGSLHNLIPEAATAFGLKVTGVENNEEAGNKLRSALSEGKLVIALMGKGNFTRSGHFIVLRGITEEDMVYVADPNSKKNTDKTWKLTQIVNEAKSWAGANGPFWIINK